MSPTAARPSSACAHGLKAALHYRRDDHGETQQLYAPTPLLEPTQTSVEDVYSLAVEDAIALAPRWDLTVAAAYDWRKLHRAEDFTNGAMVYYRLADSDGWNAQAALTYRLSDTAKLYATLSSRQRFPNLFERFSSRFGGAVSNPNLAPERATNLDIGVQASGDGWRLEAALFRSDIEDMIVSAPFVFQGQAVSQSRNVGDGEAYGAELSGRAALGPNLAVGGAYGWLRRTLNNPADPALKPTGIPEHKLFAYLDWTPTARLTVTPSVEAASDRWTVTTTGARYYKTGAHALAGLGATLELAPGVEVSASGRNLFDARYEPTDGFPEEGRSFHIGLRLTR